MFDRQYWVRDDGKGGQVIKARCGADVALALTDRATGQVVLLPDVTIKLYVVSGQGAAAPSSSEPPGGLYCAGGWVVVRGGGCEGAGGGGQRRWEEGRTYQQ